MEPEAKKQKYTDFEDGEIFDSDEDIKSSTPKKSVYTNGIELICQGASNLQQPKSPSKKTANCPIVLPFLPFSSGIKRPIGLPPIPIPLIKPEIKSNELPNADYSTFLDDNHVVSDPESELVTNEEGTTVMDINKSNELQDTVIEAKDRSFELYTKEVVKHRGGSWVRNTEPLPEGWTIINHHCGFPLYFHKDSRVITWSRPYYIGSSSVKNHKVPLTAIPCMAYLKRDEYANTKEKSEEHLSEQNSNDEHNLNAQNEITQKMCPLSEVDAQLVKSDLHLVESKDLKEYISKRFDYQEVTGKKYVNHIAYKHHLQHKKEIKKKAKELKKKENIENKAYEEKEDQDLPSIAKNFIEVKVPDKTGTGKRTITIFLSGKATVSILNEYCARALRCTPNYDLVDNVAESNQKDYKTYKVRLPDGNTYGVGSGPNVQAAKNVAALGTLKMLIPGFKPDDKYMLTGRAEEDISYFDHVKITDHRIHQLSQQVGLTPPYQFFTDIQHNHQGPHASEALDIHVFQDEKKGGGVGTAHWKFKFQGLELSGTAKSKKNGKHIAAQHMLAKLNPDLTTWGEILKKYKAVTNKRDKKEKNNEEETITQLFKVKCGPNTALINKLREMMKHVANEQKHYKMGPDHIQPLFTEIRSELPIED